MSKDDVIRMAREACPYTSDEMRGAFYEGFLKGSAAERDKYEAKFKQLEAIMKEREQQPNKPCCLAEREACAKVCDVTPPYPFRPSIEAAHAIRARK